LFVSNDPPWKRLVSLPELLDPETLEPDVPLLLGEVVVPDEDELELSAPLLVALLPLEGCVELLLELLLELSGLLEVELLWFGSVDSLPEVDVPEVSCALLSETLPEILVLELSVVELSRLPLAEVEPAAAPTPDSEVLIDVLL
jgi:hypothetical protein